MTERVLVLEDGPTLGGALQDVLADEGYEVELTPSGADALLRFARRPFDLVVADLQVQDLAGDAVWRVVRDLSGVPLIAMSASRKDWQHEAFDAGATGCLKKPFRLNELVSLASSLLRERNGETSFPDDVRALSAEDVERIRALPPERLDALPFGLIRVDGSGIIRGFNAYEEDASGYSAPSVVGLPFRDVAPCSAVKEFAAAVDEVRREPSRSRVLRFLFPRFGANVVVSVRLFHDAEHDGLWIFVSRRLPAPA